MKWRLCVCVSYMLEKCMFYLLFSIHRCMHKRNSAKMEKIEIICNVKYLNSYIFVLLLVNRCYFYDFLKKKPIFYF